MAALLRQIIRPPEDLTKGSILRNVIILSAPVALTQSLTVLFQFVDTVFVGWLPNSASALAAIGFGGQVMFFTSTLLLGLTIGTTAMVARFVGERKPDEAAVTVFNAFVICFVISVVFAAVGIWLSESILWGLGARDEVLKLGTEYLGVLMIAGVAMVLLFQIGSILQGAGDAITPFWLFGGANLVNLVLDPFFIYGSFSIPSLNLGLVHTPAVPLMGLDLGVRGAALATVIGRGTFCVIGVLVLRRGLSRVHVQPRHFRMDLKTIWQLLAIGIPSALQMMIRSASALALVGIVGHSFGKTAVAALTTGGRTVMLALMPGFGVGRAAGTLAGQNLGAGEPQRAVRSAWASVVIYSVFMAVCTLAGLLFPHFFMRMFTPDQAVINTGAVYLRYAAAVYLFAGLAIVLSKSMEGTGYTLIPMLLTFAVLIGAMLPLALILPGALGLGLHGVWMAMAFSNILLAVGTLFFFQLGAWQRRRISIGYPEAVIPAQESLIAPE
ncbi:MAG: MATE family efflux transporter [Verrucomicrobia bacterium]|nr:MATE family efflux transporter [Verrucomicrobiota bacterium]